MFAHPLFLDQLEKLVEASEREHPSADTELGPNRKLLGHVLDFAFDKIPRDPGSAAHRHGGAIAGGHREWFRRKTGNERYHLFYRFHSAYKIIVFGWLNDESSLRTTGASTDAYAVFGRMFADGHPPTNWDALLAAARDKKVVARMRRVADRAEEQSTPAPVAGRKR